MTSPLHLDPVAPGLYYGSIYWMDGSVPKGSTGGTRSEINSGVPYLGWGQAFVVDKDPTAKTVMLFCPFTYSGFQVTRHSFEYNSLKPCRDPFRRDWHERNMREKWLQAVENRWQRDFAQAAVVMKLLGMEVPLDTMPEGMEAKPTGGKEADALGLLKPVKRKGRRGDVLAFFLAAEGFKRSLHEAMAEFGVTRSNLLSQLYLLQKDHGIGYALANDAATITLPAGCDDPFEKEAA